MEEKSIYTLGMIIQDAKSGGFRHFKNAGVKKVLELLWLHCDLQATFRPDMLNWMDGLLGR